MNRMTPEEVRRAFTDRLGRPSTNIKRLAQENSGLALERLAQLMFSGNDCAALGAVRSILERADGRVPAGTPRHLRKKLDQGIRLTIKRFKEAEEDGGIRRDELPVVYGGWQGPRDIGAPCGPRLPKVRRQRARVCEQPRIGDGTPTCLQGSGTETGCDRGMSAAAAKRSTAKAKARKAEKE